MIIVMRGIPGAGKSTWIRQNYPDAVVVSADDYHSKTGTYAYDKEHTQDAHQWCLRSFIDLARMNRTSTIVVDNTNIFAVDIAPYVKIGEAYGHACKIVTLLSDPHAAYSRNEHGVTLEKVMQLQGYLEKEKLPKFWEHETLPAWMPGGPAAATAP